MSGKALLRGALILFDKMTTLNDVKTNITNQIIAEFGAEDPQQNIEFKTGVAKALNDHLDAFVAGLLEAKPQPMTAPMAAPAKKGGRNGYNEFAAQLKTDLINEMGGNDAAKEEFKKRGGVTGTWVRDAWRALSDDQKQIYNDRAKAVRDAVVAAPQMMVTPQGVAIQMATPKRTKTKWQLFQGAWSSELKKKKENGEEVPSFDSIGERTKACSEAYKEFKNKPEAEQQAYLHLYA